MPAWDDDADIDISRGRSAEPIPNYLIFAILSFFCCWPFAIAAIINAAKVNTLQAHGDYQAAQHASEQAKRYALTAVILGVIVQTLGCVVQLVLLNTDRGFR